MKVFIIDDDNLSIFLTRHLLALEGLKSVESFLSAEDALNYLIKSEVADLPDMILLDLNMPVMSGWDFLEALTPLETKLRFKSRIYILTSSLDLSDTAKSKEYSLVSGLIHKPIKTEDIRIIKSKAAMSV